MLYYILPPLIIIISVSALIMFLFRKMENVPVSEIVQSESEQKTADKLKVIKAFLIQFGLAVLEKMMHRSKLFALKFHNASNELFHSIKEKRKKGMSFNHETQPEKVAEISKQVVEEIEKKSDDDRPRVKEMVHPSSYSAQKIKSKAKEKLEEALIRRIAVNPRDIEAYERLGDYYLERENFEDSLECFKQVLKLSPTHHKAKTRIRKLGSMLK
ncbi:MAG: tetratricopeptide repeat protein [Candidatus Moranbacteria bacterium]|nr:tetratricopeptide repeat protein [Candidatus Moranbacteria bacterium]